MTDFGGSSKVRYCVEAPVEVVIYGASVDLRSLSINQEIFEEGTKRQHHSQFISQRFTDDTPSHSKSLKDYR